MPRTGSLIIQEERKFRIEFKLRRQYNYASKIQTDKEREHPDMLRRDQTQVLTGSSSECLEVSKGQRLVAELH